MCYAVSNVGDSTFKQHRSYGYFSLKFNTPVNGKSTVSSETIVVDDPSDGIKSHGWWLWTAWCLLGWLMIATKRYMKKGWMLS